MNINKRVGAMVTSWIVLVLALVAVLSPGYAAVAVGEVYEGGTVFCVSQTPDLTKCVTQGSGNYGLIMAHEDQANFDSNSDHGVTWALEAKETGVCSEDDGAANTAAILRAHPQDNPSNNAAWLCHNYRGGGQEDWYLPAKNELNKLYLYAKAHQLIGKGCAGSKPGGVQCLLGGDWSSDNRYKFYWSSTESSGGYGAWYRGFSNCLQDYAQDYANKIGFYFGARAVRAFNHLSIQKFNYLPKPQTPQGVGIPLSAPPHQVAVSAAATAPSGPPAAAAVPQAPVAAAAAPQYKRYIALADWESTMPGHLTLRRGELITISDVRNTGWWVGELNGRRGFVPANYLQAASFSAPPSQQF